MVELKNQAGNTPTLTFFWKFLIFVTLFQSIVYLIHNNLALSTLIQFAITDTVFFVYQLFIGPVTVDGNILRHIDTTRFLIVDNECTGLILLASVCAVFMAFSYSRQAKLKMIVVAVLILQGENILRILHLLFVIREENNDFDIYHLYIWQVINFITALLVIGVAERNYRDKEL